MIKKCVFSFICLSVLIACVVSSGCTSNQNTQVPVQTVPPTVATAANTMIPTTTPEATAPASVSTTVPPAAVSTIQTPANEGLSVTINSVDKKTTLGGGNPAKPGNAFLVLGVTIQNNDINKDFAYTDASFRILDTSNNGSWHAAMTNQISRGLNSPLLPGTIPPKTKKTGQIGFGVPDNSTSYKFSIVDSAGTVITTINDLRVP
jgi:hypothetical protein